jgi:GntR family transcriptional regulator / MocR family aminotransferase
MIVINNESNVPIYMQIYEQIKEKIITGQIPGGSKLPSIRTFSVTLNVSRNTVESAYLQLSTEGYIESKPGSGFISLKLDSMEFLKSASDSLVNIKEPGEIVHRVNSDKHYKYNFRDRSISAHDFPLHIWKKLSNKCLSSISDENFTSYNSKSGERGLQIELMKYLNKSRGVSCSPEQIIISSGMEYTLSLLCQLFRKDLDQIAFEDPGYIVASDIFSNNGYNVAPISLEEDGINLEELYNSSAKIVYVTPSHQFPTGAVMPIKKRLKLLDWAKRKQGIIIEDDYDSEFRYDSRPIPSLQSIDSIGCVIYIGTFSKSLSPSLRINYMVLPKSLLERYDRLFNKYRVSVSFIQQKILQQFMHQGYWDRHLRKIHLTAIRKHDLLIRLILEHMGDKVIIHGENAGLHILLEFNNGLNEKELIERAKKNGVLVSPVSIFWSRPDKYSNNMILLGFGGMPEGEIVEGVHALKNALLR